MPRGVSTTLAAVIAVIVLAAGCARIVPALREPLWLDEVVSARIITQPTPAAAVHRVRRTESSPPGWHLLNWAAWRAIGSPGRLDWLRLLSVVFGCALAGLVVFFGRTVGLSLRAAAVAGGLTALGPNLVAHGAELRPYALLTLAALAFAIVLERAARSPSRGRLAALAAVVLAGSYTHYFFLLNVATGAAWVAARLTDAVRRRILAAIGLGLVPFVPWLPSFDYQYRHDLYAYNGGFNARAVGYAYARIVGLLGQNGAVAAAVRLAFALGVVAGALILLRRRRGELTALMTLVPVALTAAIWLVGPRIFNERNLLVAAPFAAVSAGALLDALGRRLALAAGAALAVALAFSLWQFEIDYGRSSYDGIAHALVAAGWQPRDEIVQFGPAPLGLSQPVGWYLPGHPVLVHARPSGCGALYAVSYDAGVGPRWIRRHALSVAPLRTFTAYDHTPRGPRARTPIVVGRVRDGVAAERSALRAGARLIRAAGSHCGP